MARSVISRRITPNIALSRVLHRLRLSLRDAAKRGMDLLVASLGLIFLAPLFAWIAIQIRRDSPGPVFFRGPRLGRGGRVFHILKFRTMYERPESYQGPRVTAMDDPRVTPFGRWLRATKLNELPQLWNVLKGEMSLVGPRPEDPAIGAGWPAEARREVLSVRPGITSPASVLYRNEEATLHSEQAYLESVVPSKLRLDQLYVRHRSFLLDLDILFWTSLVLLPRLGSFSPPEDSLFRGPISSLFRRYINWFVVDFMVTLLAVGAAGLFWRSLGPLNVGLPKAIGAAFAFAFLFSLTGVALGINRISWSQASFYDILDILPAAAAATGIALLVNRLWKPEPLLPAAMILAASSLAFVGFVLSRYGDRWLEALAARWLRLRGQARAAQERVLIVGGGQAGQFAAWLLSENGRNRAAFQVVGFVDDDLYKQGMRIRGVNVLGRRDDIPRLVRELDVGLLVFAIHNIQPEERQRLLEICSSAPARLVMLPDILGMLSSSAAHPLARERDSLSPQQVQGWLDELSELIDAGDLQAVRLRLQGLRQELRKQDSLNERT